jgi:SAM-dependent methyltransferase
LARSWNQRDPEHVRPEKPGVCVTDEHIRLNRARWEEGAAEYVEAAERNWASDEPKWGVWGVPESQLHVLPDDLDGKDAVELGCGTAYVSAWLARRGAKPVGIDLTTNQLATARRLRAEHGMSFPLIQANAEQVPLKDGLFDLAISEYGACLWCDPYRWIPESARLLRPGGQLIFLTSGVLLMLTVPMEGAATDRLIRDYFGMHRFHWEDTNEVDFHLNHGDMLRLLRANGFNVEDLIEVRPPEDATTRYPFLTLEWSRRWPSVEVWKARKLRDELKP